MAILSQLPEKRKPGARMGSLERAALLSSSVPSGGPAGQEAAAQNRSSPGSCPLAPAPAAAAIETPGVHTGLKLNTHPGLGPEPGRACCRGRHGNAPRAGQRAERAGILTPSRGSARPGALLRGSPALLASAGAGRAGRAAREVEPQASPLPARTPSSP